MIISLLGLLTETGKLPSLIKGGTNGTLLADFVKGTISTSGFADTYDLGTGQINGQYVYSGAATINSSGFSGNFMFGGVSGSWNGQFFGPAAQEVGARFTGSNGTSSYVGTLIGSSGDGYRGLERDLLGIKNATAFGGFRLTNSQTIDLTTGKTTFEQGSAENFSNSLVRYDPNGAFGHRWEIQLTFVANESELDAAKSNATYSLYGDLTPDANGVKGMRLLNPGPENPLIQLTYVTYGSWESGTTTGSDLLITRNQAIFGREMDPSTRLTTGSANYSGLLFGVASSKIAGSATSAADRYYSLGGTTDFTIDFANSRWTGSINPIGFDRNSTDQRDFGTYNFVNGLLGVTVLHPTALKDSTNTGVGSIWGRLFGPQGVEAGGAFSIDHSDPLQSGYVINMGGLFVAKKN